MQLFRAAFLLAIFSLFVRADDSEWIQPQKPGDPLVWGRHDGIVFGLPTKPPEWGIPRGLIRVGIWPKGAKGPQLLNYIAIEPVVALPTDPNKKGFSELEQSQLDPGKEGKRLWVDKLAPNFSYLVAGKFRQTLIVPNIEVERFSVNGAKVHLTARISSDRPNEIRFQVFADKDSPPIKELTLTATMGNWERLRLIWLADQVLDSRKLGAEYKDKGFAADTDKYPVSEMLRLPNGDPIVYAASSEANPAAADAAWHYNLPKLTQYWTVPTADVQPDLRLRVNERDVYWGSDKHVFGGIAFENFEFRQKYVPGQTFIFGISRKEPWDLYDGVQKLKPYPLDSAPKKQ